MEELLEDVFIPKREIILSRPFCVRGQDAVLAALTSGGGKNSLWLFYHRPIPQWFLDGGGFEATTHREEREYTLLDTQVNNFWPQSLCVQGKTLSFTSSGTAPLLPDSHREYMIFQHFAEKGVCFRNLAQYPAASVSVMHCEFDGDGIFSAFDPSRPLGLSLTAGAGNRELPIGKTHVMAVDGGPANVRFSFSGEDGTECGYYLDGLFLYEPPKPDPQQEREAEARMRALGLTEGQIADIRKIELDACHRGHKLLVLEYEAEGDTQLNFYTKAFLDSPLETANGAASIFVLVPGHEKGMHGLRRQTCTLGPVPQDLTGPVEIELFSRCESFPGETIVIK